MKRNLESQEKKKENFGRFSKINENLDFSGKGNNYQVLTTKPNAIACSIGITVFP